MDKWLQLVIAESQIALGLRLNTRRIAVGVTRTYLGETLKLIITVWFKDIPSKRGRRRFTAIEASKWSAS